MGTIVWFLADNGQVVETPAEQNRDFQVDVTLPPEVTNGANNNLPSED